MSREDHVMSMSEVQKLTGLSARTLQYYDDMGYLRVGRDEHGYRVYTDQDLRNLFVIILLKEMGFSLEEIAEFQNNRDDLFEKATTALTKKLEQINCQIEIVKCLSEIDGKQIGFNLFDPKMINKDCKRIIGNLQRMRAQNKNIQKGH